MRQLLVAMCMLAFTACGDDTAPSSSADLAVRDMAMSLSCATTCSPACGAGLTCVMGPSPLSAFSATCLAPCTSDVDCAGGKACVQIVGVHDRFCVGTGEPQSCGTHCDFIDPGSSCNGNLLVTPFLNGVVCGGKYQHCANGCVEDAPDGGTDRHAHCS